MGKFYFTCSFDDGDISDLRLAELMRNYDIEGTFYIPQSCDQVNKSLSESEIRSLSSSVEIGGHTMSHQILTYTTPDKARYEIQTCKKWLEDVIGKPVNSFCPPTGRFNKQHIAFQKEAGFTAMRTVEMLAYKVRKIKNTDGFVELPTTSQLYHHTKHAYVNKCLKRFNFTSYPVFNKLYNQSWTVMSTHYIGHIRGLCKRNDAAYYFHLWGHSWEIDKYSLWDSLELFFRNLNETEGIIFCNNSELAEIVTANGKDQ